MPNQRTKPQTPNSIRNLAFYSFSHAPSLDLPFFVDSLVREGSVSLSSDAGYDVVSEIYDTSPWAKFWDRNEVPLVERAISKVGKLRNALDVGSGTGRYTHILSKYAEFVTGVDVSEGMVRVARGKTERVDFIKADVRDFLARPSKFDVVVCARVLSHIPNAASLVREIVRSHLNESGTIIISDLHPRHSYSVTSFEVGGFRINLETFKHDFRSFMVDQDTVEWSLQEVNFDQLLWKPSPYRFSTISRSSGLPIFYVLVGRRTQGRSSKSEHLARL